jgi:hypothetical protein
MPGQAATAFEHGKPGLSLSGAGTLNPIEQGKPRAPTIERIPVPKSGLSAPRNAANGHAIHALGPIDKGTKAAGTPMQSHQAAGGQAPKGGVVRISSSLGEVKLNFHKVTNGLAHGAVAPGRVRNAANPSTGTTTVWSESSTSTTTAASNSSAVTAVVASSSASTSSATSTSSSATTTVATTAGSSGNVSSGSSGSGSSGSGATGSGSSGTGNNGNSGSGHSGNDGNGNSGNNGHHYGWYKHH